MFRIRHVSTEFATVLLVGFRGLTAAGGQAIPTDRPTVCSAYESVPLPAETEKAPTPKTPPGCASYRSYRGIGRPVNYKEARACAFQERKAHLADLHQNPKEPTAWFVGGSLILADLYFNGAGVKRDISLGMRFACETDESMATLALPDVEKLRNSVAPDEPFELCEFATTSFAMNFCNNYLSEIEDDRRVRYYNSFKSSLPPDQQAAFEKLLAAQSAYITAHANEVDQGGTIRGIRTDGSQRILKDLFRTEVVHFERRKWPMISDEQVTTADVMLEREFERTLQELRKQTQDQIDEGAVTADHVSSVEKIWETYREAWVAFASLRYPAAVVPAIRAQISLDRYRLLKTIR
jgi:hypothetical protein